MINLIIDCRMINNSGIGTYLKNIIPGLIDSNRFQITCMGYANLKYFSWFHLIKYISVNSKVLSIEEQFEFLFKIPSCDIFWSPHFNVPFIKINKGKRVVTIHDVYQLAKSNDFTKVKSVFYKIIINRAIKLSSKIITVSEFSKKEILKYTGATSNKIIPILNGIADDYNKNYKCENINEKYILCVGNILPHKNLILALRAFSKIDRKDIKFIIVGKYFQRNIERNLDEILDDLRDKVIFTGQVSDDELKHLYANATLFLFPSKYEGFGFPILEAMKFDLPIIASNIASIPEVGGTCINYFDPFSENDLTKKINNFFNEGRIDNPYRYTEHLKKFNWSRVINQHINCFESVVYG